ncbi:MAG: signal peptide peptidase SppA [Bacteroides sp.]|nr:signal peptide peptidase SppA [Bacteroides sp.]
MLKKFFMNTLSSFMGAWLALVLFCVVAVLVGIGVVSKLGSAVGKSQEIKRESVLVIDLNGPIIEREIPTEFDYVSLLKGDLERPATLTSLLTAIGEAKVNDNISAIYLKCGGVQAAPATLNALRDALIDFREDGEKDVIAYGDSYGMGDYFVASVADKIYLNPAGQVELKGLGGTNMFLKGLFDKLGVEFQVVKVGTYKSAVEPYINTEMSAPARAQLDTLYGNMWRYITDNIRVDRKMIKDDIDSLINNDFIFIRDAAYDKAHGLVDELCYESSMDTIVADMIGKEVKKLNYVSPSALLSQTDWGSAYAANKKIAVLYATGEIVDGGGAATINYEKLVPQIMKLADDKTVLGMVLRVNSPGGAVFGSEQIGQALDAFQSRGKTLAVSMGDYAASGGYWISCCADRIFADPLTITGSIGIFGLIPNAKGLMDKIGVNPQTVSTNPDAAFPSLYYPMNGKQKDAMQKYVESGYDKFVARVARGRKMPEAKVRLIGEGRVWDAMKAIEIGLVDEQGSLYEAVDWVAEREELSDSYDVAVYPSIESTMWDMLPELANMDIHGSVAGLLDGGYERYMLKFAESVLKQKPIQARMPYMFVEFTR